MVEVPVDTRRDPAPDRKIELGKAGMRVTTWLFWVVVAGIVVDNWSYRVGKETRTINFWQLPDKQIVLLGKLDIFNSKRGGFYRCVSN